MPKVQAATRPCRRLYNNLKTWSDRYLEISPFEYAKDSENIRLTTEAKSENASMMITCALMYSICREDKYFDKAWEIMSAVAAFPDWNPFHFL